MLKEIKNKLNTNIKSLTIEQEKYLNNEIALCNTKNIEITPELYEVCKIVYGNIVQHKSEVRA